VPCKKARLDNPDSAVAGKLLAVWSRHIGHTRPSPEAGFLTQEHQSRLHLPRDYPNPAMTQM
jgi:hypothetical protein